MGQVNFSFFFNYVTILNIVQIIQLKKAFWTKYSYDEIVNRVNYIGSFNPCLSNIF